MDANDSLNLLNHFSKEDVFRTFLLDRDNFKEDVQKTYSTAVRQMRQKVKKDKCCYAFLVI